MDGMSTKDILNRMFDRRISNLDSDTRLKHSIGCGLVNVSTCMPVFKVTICEACEEI